MRRILLVASVILIAILLWMLLRESERPAFQWGDDIVEIPCEIAGQDAARAERLAVWTVLNEQYKAAVGREISEYDCSGEDIPKEFYDCVESIGRQETCTNGGVKFVVEINRTKLNALIERSWVSVPVDEDGRSSLRKKRKRLREEVDEVGQLFGGYSARIYKATRIGMFEIAKDNRSDSEDVSVDVSYELEFDRDAYEKLEKRFRSAVRKDVLGEKTVQLKEFNDWEIRKVYEEFWKECGFDKAMGYCIIAFVTSRSDKSLELRMLVVPAQIYNTVGKLITDESRLEFTFESKDSNAPTVRDSKRRISFWRKPYTEFSDYEHRPIEFHDWICRDDSGGKGFVKREFRQSMKLPTSVIRSLKRCDIRIYSGKNATRD